MPQHFCSLPSGLSRGTSICHGLNYFYLPSSDVTWITTLWLPLALWCSSALPLKRLCVIKMKTAKSLGNKCQGRRKGKEMDGRWREEPLRCGSIAKKRREMVSVGWRQTSTVPSTQITANSKWEMTLIWHLNTQNSCNAVSKLHKAGLCLPALQVWMIHISQEGISFKKCLF